MNNHSFNSKLLDAIKADQLVLFCGAGTSCFSGFPSWKELTISVLDNLVTDFKDLAPFKELIRTNTITPLDALGYVQKYKDRVWEHITQKISISQKTNLLLQKELLLLSKKIVTTNYDKAFETAAENSLNIILSNNNFKLSRLNDAREYLFKIHGDIDNPGDCILFKSDYEKLYEQDKNAYLLEIQKLFTNKTILFIGFSLADPYVEEILHSITKIYEGYNKDHFIITTDKTFNPGRFENKIFPIVVDSFNDLPGTITQLRQAASAKNSAQIKKNTKKRDLKKIIKPKHKLPLITILRAKPIDKDFVFRDELLADSLSKYSIEIERDYLSITTLQGIEESNYLFLFTRSLKGSFLIEDEYLKSTQMGVSDIDENIPGNLIKAVIIFYEGDDYTAINISCERPYILINTTGLKHKDVFNKFVYQFFAKKQIPNLNSSTITNNSKRSLFAQYDKGKCVRKDFHPIISKHLDTKALTRFIGRKTDLENIIRKLIDLKHESKILTIKGAGGIGKTTLITKAITELLERRFYPQGVFFVPCQSISTLENFKFEISQCFEFATSIELEKQIADNFIYKDRVLILDNFETLLNIHQRDAVLKLVSFISDYAIIVTTTRQKLDLDFEEVYDLRNLTTDEGLELFLSLYPRAFPETDRSLIRHELIERLLNNNPLAIKLIAKGTPPDKDILVLIRELDEDIFKNENIDQIFERPEDINIERTKSLYQSINYSYQLLSEKERFGFEILSIFPDGMHLESFKRFYKLTPKIKFKIEDKDIKNLDDKSLLERRNNLLRLQSIVSRFAENQFKKRDEDIRIELYTNAFNFNMHTLSVLTDRRYFKPIKSLRLLDMHFNNFLKILESIEIIDIGKEKKLEFINLASYLYTITNQEEQFIKNINNLRDYFNDIENGTTLLDCIRLSTLFYVKNFDRTFTEIQNVMPFNNLPSLNRDNYIQDQIYVNAVSVYECEGYTYELLNMGNLSMNELEEIIFQLYKLGYIARMSKIIEETLIDDEFSILEIKNTLSKVDAEYIAGHIKTIYKKDTLEIVQCTYTLSKRVDIPLEDIKKLVISNPYTRGLIRLMRIPHITEEEDIKKAYLEAIKALEHIKFYYLEAIIYYCEYLKSIKDKSFSEWHAKGYKAAKKYKYCYQIFLFEKLASGDTSQKYDEESYTKKYSPLSESIENSIKKLITNRKKKNRSRDYLN